jgi:hypothetical protein
LVIDPATDGAVAVIVKVGAEAEDSAVLAGIPELKVIVHVSNAPGLFNGEQLGVVVIPETVEPLTAVAVTPDGN